MNVCVLFTKALVMALLLIKLAEKTERIFGCFPLRKAFCTRDFILFFSFCPQNYILIHTEWCSCSHSDSEIVNSLHGCVCLPVCVCPLQCSTKCVHRSQQHVTASHMILSGTREQAALQSSPRLPPPPPPFLLLSLPASLPVSVCLSPAQPLYFI